MPEETTELCPCGDPTQDEWTCRIERCDCPCHGLNDELWCPVHGAWKIGNPCDMTRGARREMTMRMPKRHEADVTADRLIGQSEKFSDLLDGYEKDALGLVVNALREIADGARALGR